jgi:hypothetical protein
MRKLITLACVKKPDMNLAPQSGRFEVTGDSKTTILSGEGCCISNRLVIIYGHE